MRALKMGAILAWALAFQLQAAPPGQYTVARGDCLWSIAARVDVYGDPWKWPLLHEANPALIKDPDLIEPGWRLNVPLSPGAGRLARARLFAQRYKEAPTAAPRVPVVALPDLTVAAAETEAAPRGADPSEARRIVGSALAALLLFLAGFAALSYRKMKRKAAAQAVLASASRPEAAMLPVQALQAEEPVPAVGQPTESEAILRAEDAPDPLHPEEGRQAA